MTDNTWDGKITNLNISQQAFPELYRELSKMHHKARSDRLRSLALIGLYSLRFCGNISSTENVTPNQQDDNGLTETVNESDKLNTQRDSLKGKLLGSVGNERN